MNNRRRPESASAPDLILEECRQDDVGLWEIVDMVSRAHRELDPQALKERTLEILFSLLHDGLICAGFPQGEPIRFVASSKLAHEVISDIRREWDALDHPPSLADIIWFTSPDRATYL